MVIEFAQGLMKRTFELNEGFGFIAQYLEWANRKVFFGTLMLPVISYRGHSSADWDLLPSMYRDKPQLNAEKTNYLRQCEAEVICEFRSRFGLSDWTDLEVLAYAQHHGAPTGLLDWTENPLIGLWFAVSEKQYDSQPGVVHQLNAEPSSSLICGGVDLTLEHAWGPSAKRFAFLRLASKLESPQSVEGSCKRPIHVFRSPSRLGRTGRQRSVFSVSCDAWVDKPLNQVLQNNRELRKIEVPSSVKSLLRYVLPTLGLDPFSIYGGPDAFGRSLAHRFDFADFLDSLPEPSTGSNTNTKAMTADKEGTENSPAP